MVQYTEWRSISDGSIISSIPDSEIYLQDDWEDNKLTNRDGSGTTVFNGVTGVYRPEWDKQEENPQVENGVVTLEGDAIVTSDVDFSEAINNQTVTWEFDYNIPSGDSSDWVTVQLFAETDEWNDLENRPNLDRAYFVGIRLASGSGGLRFHRADTGGDFTELFTGNPSTSGTIVVEREANGDWELFLDSSSVGSTNDNTYTDAKHVGIASRDGSFQATQPILEMDKLKIS